MKQSTQHPLREQLTVLEQTLKQEFFGIDHVIERIVELITPWVLYPELQSRPLIINLWGMTGVGKTSLIVRLTELLNMSNRMFRFDMGENEQNEYSFKGTLYDIYRLHNGKPIMICLDEFQQARTIQPNGAEISRPEGRIIWELLDSGVIEVNEFNFSNSQFFEFYHALQLMIDMGVKAKNGRITHGKKYFENILSRIFPHMRLPVKHDDLLVPEQIFVSLQNISRKRCLSIPITEETFNTMNEREIYDVLTQLSYEVSKPVKLDCRKSLIFVAGNLDDAYQMSSEMNPDVDADVLHRASLNINIAKIKNTLQTMFRNEQIARLGNLHLIYPALSKKAYRQIIQKSMSDFKDKIAALCDIDTSFDRSFLDLIYREGVYPAHGTRPLFSTIQHLALGQLGPVMNEYYKRGCKGTNMVWSYQRKKILVRIVHEQKTETTITLTPQLTLEQVRVSRKDELQTIVGVHEAGHAIIGMALKGIYPEHIYSVTSDNVAEGFTLFSQENNIIINRQNAIHEMAQHLGGYAAEQLIFGTDYITMGSTNDLNKATQFAMQLISKNGLGEDVAAYQKNLGHDKGLLLADVRIQQQVQMKLREALGLAEKTLHSHYNLFLALCKHLSEHPSIDKQQLIRLTEKTDPTLLQQINERKSVYKSMLQMRLETAEQKVKLFGHLKLNPTENVNKVWLHETE